MGKSRKLAGHSKTTCASPAMDNSSAPLIFKRSGKGKPRTTRQATPDPEDGEQNGEAPSALAAKLKSRVKKSRTKSQLSFGGAEEEEEGDGEVFQVKKSKLSQKMTLGKTAACVGSPLPRQYAEVFTGTYR